MSERLESALPGAQSTGLVTVAEAGLRGMVSLRCDLESGAKALRAATGCAVPAVRQMTRAGDVAVAWMSPDEVMILCAHDAADGMVTKLTEGFGTAHHLAVNVSDARAVFDVTGAGWRDVLAKLTPADLSPDAFAPGEVRRTRLAQAAAAFWLEGDDHLRIVCFRSVAQYVFDLLTLAARHGGAVGYHSPSSP